MTALWTFGYVHIEPSGADGGSLIDYCRCLRNQFRYFGLLYCHGYGGCKRTGAAGGCPALNIRIGTCCETEETYKEDCRAAGALLGVRNSTLCGVMH